jgi:aspartate 1-decarboxylase
MRREFLQAKIHFATITGADLEYEGSLGMDSDLMKQIGILPFESVEVYNVTTGARIRTYAIELPAGSKRFESNGAAAHHIRKGDKVIIATYVWLETDEIRSFKPRVMILGPENKVKSLYDKSIAFENS